ncbi:MAG: hypothetical protein COB50_05595 [Thiotrichales bacterium]|nr:MAG: hypothetical protein COB50_05595 [Thiotrichales bacterium]
MKGSKEAVAIWQQIPNNMRLTLLNNVFCGNCGTAVGISDATAKIYDDSFLIHGNCIECGHNVVRHIEDLIKPSGDDHAAKLMKLASYAKNSKFNQMLEDLIPLQIRDSGLWDPISSGLFEDEDESENDPTEQIIYKDVLAKGSRYCWEMEQVLPGHDPDDLDCPILQGIAIREAEGISAGIAHFKSLIKVDPRCLDAYAHIGNTYFNMSGRQAKSMAKTYYKQGVAIGLKFIGNHINDVFSWGLIDNRPFLRCLEGFGLCLLEQGKTQDALSVFKHMLLLNPLDNQGIRFIIDEHQEEI